MNGGILPQIVHCLLSGSIDAIVSGVPRARVCLVPGQSFVVLSQICFFLNYNIHDIFSIIIFHK